MSDGNQIQQQAPVTDQIQQSINNRLGWLMKLTDDENIQNQIAAISMEVGKLHAHVIKADTAANNATRLMEALHRSADEFREQRDIAVEDLLDERARSLEIMAVRLSEGLDVKVAPTDAMRILQVLTCGETDTIPAHIFMQVVDALNELARHVFEEQLFLADADEVDF